MATSRTRRLIYTGATAAGLLAGAAGIAAAATSQSAPPPTTNTPAAEANDTPDASPNYTASVTAPDTENESNLASLATITPDQARQAAAAATGGTAGPANLENENGNVVYGVEVTKPDGTALDIKVDAGNATVLSQQSGGDNEHNDGPDTNGSQEGSAESRDD